MVVRALGKYRITYESNGFIQEKYLISHDDYENIIKEYNILINELEIKRDYSAAKFLKKELKYLFGEHWFTDRSPIYYSIETGIIKLLNGNYKCKILDISHEKY